MLAVVVVAIGIPTRQRLRYWLFAVLALALQYAASNAIAPLYHSVRSTSAEKGDATPALWIALGLVLIAWVAPVLIVWLGYRSQKREAPSQRVDLPAEREVSNRTDREDFPRRNTA